MEIKICVYIATYVFSYSSHGGTVITVVTGYNSGGILCGGVWAAPHRNQPGLKGCKRSGKFVTIAIVVLPIVIIWRWSGARRDKMCGKREEKKITVTYEELGPI